MITPRLKISGIDRFDGNERAIQQFLGSKGLDPASVEG
jgi:hypothetical protein